ncbi:helix-turn-helix transcriptional regulator [Rhodococcus tukisamuensis]|uniref:Predicted transcriptional regulator, ArsR family n=1 Tax=Rhodococcus tukisamuensis TaxID=168276 RepID=A0A1G6R4S0_9NOCA|nr:helix-turn-helix domain-containing protein [Rhodococcus tukisamuensis]SDC99055.1 Predicted transcriptional regulator, ArsR family [Rhodococcus tukisamuensis]
MNDRRSPRTAAHAVLASPSRRRLLDVLSRSAAALDARHLADESGLHVSTVRFHLAALEQAGLVRTAPAAPTGRGRPQLLYRAVQSDVDRESGRYGRLAAVLIGRWTGSGEHRDSPGSGSRRAELAGDDWAAQELATLTPSAPQTMPDAVRTAAAVLDRLGYDPEITEARPDSAELTLHTCPYADLLAVDAEVVCAVHLGLLRGLVGRLGHPDAAIRVGPWSTPGRCVAHLSAADGPSTERHLRSESAQ